MIFVVASLMIFLHLRIILKEPLESDVNYSALLFLESITIPEILILNFSSTRASKAILNKFMMRAKYRSYSD